jgi:succinate dehydrogenase/fumarate reductase flavoprotein subunit
MRGKQIEEKSNLVSRRSFLTGAAVVAAGAAVGLVGCDSPASGVQGGGTTPADITWDEETDILVAGGGVGLAAAIAANENNADVIIIERGDHVGGLWITAGGSCTMGGNNIVQQRDGVTGDTVDKWFEDEMYSCEYRGNPDVMRALCERGADTVKWLEDLGFVWDTIGNGVLRPGIKRGIQPAQNPGVYEGGSGTPNAGICWTQVWENRLKEIGIEPRLNTRLTGLYRQANDGPVEGVEVTTSDGAKKNIKARKGVILCTGTWTDNERMAYAWDPRIVGENCYGDGGIPAENKLLVDSAGDGHILASGIGAALADMSFVSYIYLFFGSRSYWGWGEDPIDWSTNAAYASGKGVSRSNNFYRHTILTVDGKRYINECEGYTPTFLSGRGGHSENPELPYTRTYLELPKPRNVWAIGDSKMAAELKWPLDEINNPNPRTGSMFDPACLAVADTIEDLASKMGYDAATLKATIDAYNGYVDAGKDDEFNKPEFGFKIDTAPFYGFKASLIRHTQRNGLRVNTKSQVLQEDDQLGHEFVSNIDSEKVIPHLYAAGELGDALGYRRPHNSLGHYTTAARIAAENAAKETPI